MLNLLPDNVLVNVVKNLDYKDLVSISLVNHRLNGFSRNELDWSALCAHYWLVTKLEEGLHSWKEQFALMYADWHMYIDCYRTIRTAWNRIFEFCSENAPRIAQSFLAGLSEAELDDLELHLGGPLPRDFRCSYRMYNGQRMCMNASAGVFGSYGVYGGVSDFLVPLRGRYHGDYRISTVLPGCIPVARSSAETSPPLLFCVAPYVEQFIPVGWVFSVPSPHPSLSPHHYRNHIDLFCYARNFTEFLCAFADRIRNSVVEYGGSILKYVPKSSSRTGPFQVSVATAFVREASTISPDQFFFHYRINMEMDEDASKEDSCQLDKRHWVITDSDGKQDIVDGEGVVGEFPYMRPGEQYSWISSTSFGSHFGLMKGHFTMRNLLHGSPMQIQCPEFRMEAPAIERYRDRARKWEGGVIGLGI